MISDYSIKKPVFAWMLMIGLMVFGAISFMRLGVSQLPDVDAPIISVNMTWEGASPVVMETEIAEVLESAVISISGIKEISSSSSQGRTRLSIEFQLDKDIEVAFQEVTAKVTQAQRNLPDDVDPAVVSKSNPEDSPIMWVSLYGNKSLKELIHIADRQIRDQFTTVSGVGEVILGGYIDPNLRVYVDPDKLRQKELTIQDVITAIQSQHVELPAGKLENAKQELNIRVLGEALNVDEFQKIIIPGRSGSPLLKTFRIKDIADVEDGLAEISRISRTQKEPTIGLGIRKQRGTNAVAVAKAVKAKVESLQSQLPPGVKLSVVFDSTKFIEESTHEMNFTLILSAILTSVVCFLFLGSLSSSFNIVLAIPTSILGTFIIIHFMGFTLNTFTLLGLTLVIGIVVDDAIMVLENIVRHLQEGKNRVKAALLGAREIAFAAMAASISILAIFIPVVFMQGQIGKYFFQFGVTISAAVMISLLEALTLAPMRCSQFLTIGHSFIARGMDHLMENLNKYYLKALHFCLSHRLLVLVGTLAFFVISLQMTSSIKREFIPPQDQGRFQVRVQMPLGTSLENTDQIFKIIESKTLEIPGVERYFAAIGGFGGGESNTGMMFVTLKEKNHRPISSKTKKPYSQQEIMGLLRSEINKVKGVEKVIVRDPSLSALSTGRGFPVEISLRGGSLEKLGELTQLLIKKMEDSKLMTDIDTDYLTGMPEIHIIPDREKAALRGVGVNVIAQNIQALIGGVRAGKYTQDGKRYDIRLQTKRINRQSITDFQKIWIRNNRGELIRLSEVIKIEQKKSLLSINRKDRERTIGIFANVAQGKSQSEAIDFVMKTAKEILPSGYRAISTGTSQSFTESFNSLYFALIFGIFVAYMVLASQFNSFLHPIYVLLALPFSVTGAFLALKMTGYTLNLYSMIGLLLLMGIVKKNSILLVDFTNEKRKSGLDANTALLEACPVRLRPILMTSIATIAAAIPPAISVGPGAETSAPMAVVIIGGVLLSTFLTLFVVPSAYSLFARFEGHGHDADLKQALFELGETPKDLPTQP